MERWTDVRISHTNVAVVGAGPAGLAAGLAAAEAGARVTIIDEYAAAGGQYFRQPQAQFKSVNSAVLGKSYEAGRAMLDQVKASERIVLRTGTLVWGAFDEGVLELEHENRCERLSTQRIVVATGAYERPIPFPGWTLPGVTTAGAAQAMLKANFALPGRRILMSGTGPFQLPVASQLSKAGAHVVAILETRTARDFFRLFPKPWQHIDKIAEASAYFATLLARRIPLGYGQAVVEARGDGAVEEAVIGPSRRKWAPRRWRSTHRFGRTRSSSTTASFQACSSYACSDVTAFGTI